MSPSEKYYVLVSAWSPMGGISQNNCFIALCDFIGKDPKKQRMKWVDIRQAQSGVLSHLSIRGLYQSADKAKAFS